jgi:hypothetical protein
MDCLKKETAQRKDGDSPFAHPVVVLVGDK